MSQGVTPASHAQRDGASVEATNRPRPRRRRRVRTVLAALFAVVIIAAVILYHRLTTPERILALLQTRLDELPCPASAASATFSFFGGVVVGDLSIGPCGQAPGGEPVPSSPALPPSTFEFRCPSLRVIHDPLQLLLGRFRAERVVAEQPSLDLIGDFKYATRPLAELREKLRAKAAREGRVLPVVEVHGGRLRVFDPVQGEPNLLAEVGVMARAVPSGPGSGAYDIAWQSGNQSGRALYDIRAGRLRDQGGGSPWVSLPTAITAFSPRSRKSNQWCRMSGLAGEVRIRDFDFALKGLDVAPSRMVVEAREASLAIPASDDEKSIAPAERFLQFASIQGEAIVMHDQVTVAAAAELHGRPVRFSMQIPGGATAFREQALPEFRYELAVDGLAVPAIDQMNEPQRRALRSVPKVEKLARDLAISGPVDIELSVVRAAGSAKTVLEKLAVQGDGASARPAVCPYSLEGIKGEVVVLPDGVSVRSVCGRRGDASVCVNGEFTGRSGCASAQLIIVAHDVAIDDELYAALGSDFSPIKEQFQPQGDLSGQATLTRPQCQDGNVQPFETDVTVDLEGVRAKYVELPYEFEDIRGTIRATADTATIDLAGRTAESPVQITGQLRRTNEQQAGPPRTFQVRVSAQRLPMDERFHSALPPQARTRLDALRLLGHANIDADLRGTRAQEPFDYSAEIELLSASIRPEELPVLIQDIGGRISIGPERIEFVDLTGRYNDAAISAEGRIPGPAARGPGELALTLDVVNLRPDDQLVSALPPSLAEIANHWRVEGPIFADVQVAGARASADAEWDLDYNGELRLSGSAVRFAELPAAFTNVEGVLAFNETGLRTEDLRGYYGKAAVSASVQVRREGGRENGRIALAMGGVRLDEEFLSLLPGAVARSVRRLQPSGYLDATLDRLEFTRAQAGRPLEWSTAGSIQMHDVSLSALHIRGASGEITLSGLIGESEHGAVLAGELGLDRVVVLDRELSALQTPWSLIRSQSGEGELAFERINADLYSGELSGRGELRFDTRSSECNLTAVMQNVHLGPFLNAGRSSEASLVEATGLLSANLYLAGDFSRSQSLRGGGRFEVIEGDLYKLPIILAILNVLELTTKPTGTFDEATADFYIAGRLVSLRDIVLRGGILALVGSGSLTLPDLAADLRLVNVPDQWWARLPLVSEVMQGAVRELAQVRVTGPVSQPSVRTEPIPRVTEEIRDLFQRRGTRQVPPRR